MNEKEVLRERRVKDSSRGWGVGVRKAICHFPLRGRGTRAASLRGFLQISAPFSSVSPVWPAEARWQLQLIAQQRLVWKEWEKGVRTRLREDERLLRARRKCPSHYPQASFPTRDGKEPIPAEAN